ncbi:MAG: ABC transporter ATP-binding protein [Candidatus Bathyarchaeia archaeon]
MSLIKIEELSVEYYFKGKTVKALNNVSFNIPQGKVTAILGESGSGKSTLAKTILGVLPPNGRVVKGKIFFRDKNLIQLSEEEMQEIRGKHISLIPQNALNALSPIHKLGNQLSEVLMERMKLNKDQAIQRVKETFKIVGLSEEMMNRYFFELSGGMKERALIAASLLFNPEVAIADEPTTGLDAILQYKLLKEFRSLQERTGITIIFISHDISACAYVSDLVAVLYGGYIFEYGPSEEIFLNPRNPYTFMLLRSHTDIKKRRGDIEEIKGSPVDLLNPPKGCVFHPRCPYAKKICEEKTPPLKMVEKEHLTLCHFDVGGKIEW